MTTVINNPGDNGNNSSGAAGVLIGAVVVVLVLVIALIYSLPYLRSKINAMTHPSNPTINVQLPNLPAAQSETTTK